MVKPHKLGTADAGRAAPAAGHWGAACPAAQRKPRKRRAEAEVRALTQEELLAEAAETELVNTASLARLIAVEEEARCGRCLPNEGLHAPVPRALLSTGWCLWLRCACQWIVQVA